ncbi:MAG: xanthine dehydrogenase family protein subunit M [Pseudomonadota bacterium]
MEAFTYRKPGSADEAVATLNGADDGKFMAGGMTLLPTMKQMLAAPDTLVDLGGIDGLVGISRDGDTLVVGAMTTHASVAASAEVQSAIPALAALASGIGDPMVRNRGTIGGSIANADPAADYPAAVVGLNATVNTNTRSIAADDFFVDVFETALADDELVVSVSFPIPAKAAYRKFPNPASRYAVVGVMVAQTGDGVRVAVTGAGPSVFREAAFEQALGGNFAADALDGLTVDASNLNEDIHASAAYRANLVSVMAKRAVSAC